MCWYQWTLLLDLTCPTVDPGDVLVLVDLTPLLNLSDCVDPGDVLVLVDLTAILNLSDCGSW